MKWAVAYLVLAISIASVIATQGSYFKLQELASNGVETTGQVTETHCDNHQTFSFQFRIDDRPYSGIGMSGITQSCSESRAGDQVQVFYLPNTPAINVSGDPKAQLSNERLSIGAAALLIPAIVVLGWRHRRNAQQGAQEGRAVKPRAS
jgi:hypothetical protein